MVAKPAIEEELCNSIDPPDRSDPKSTDSFFSFDSIGEWFRDNHPTTKSEVDSVEIGDFEFGGFEMGEEHDDRVENPGGFGELVVDGSGAELKVEVDECKKLGALSCSVEEDLGDGGNAGVSGLDTSSGSSSESSEESESAASSSSSEESDGDGDREEVKAVAEVEEGKILVVSGEEDDDDYVDKVIWSDDDADNMVIWSDVDEEEEGVGVGAAKPIRSKNELAVSDEDREEVKLAAEVEEGEILVVSREDEDDDVDNRVIRSDDDDDDDDVDNMVIWSDVDEEEEGVGVGVVKPIRSKNELVDLPPVPPVDVELQPNHQMLPVGVVLSIIGAKVIVEGVEQHNPLSEGSILWITEKRSPLGLIDEIFGPVENPYYVVRYNSETEVPAGLQDGSTISFVSEFANHVLDDKSLYKKGYDASGLNDEEVTDESEFSDDEKELEYKRMQKSSKRGLNDPNLGNGKNNKKGRQRKNNKPSGQQPTMDNIPRPANQRQQHNVPPQDHGNDASGFPPIPNGAWNNGMVQYAQPQPQGTVFPGVFPAEAMPWLLQNLLQIGMSMPFQQQFVPTQRSPPCPPGGQSGFVPGLVFPPRGGYMGQNSFNQATFGMMGSQGQQLPPSGNAGLATNPNGTQMGQNQNFRPPNAIQGNGEAPREFNQGSSNGRGRGRRQHRRGGDGGRLGGGRGRQQSR